MTIGEQDLEILSKTEDDAPHITDCEALASYSWLNKNGHALLVPGQPPAWTPPAIAEKLKEDDAEYFRDPNAARYPSHPMEPAVRAILAVRPEFPNTSVDIFACSSTIGNLLRFVSGEEKQFRTLVEAIGDSVFFERRENSPTELIPNVRGFGHTFPEAYTSWDAEVKGSVSHQRIIKYNFDGLSCLVRFGVDGYLKDKSPESSKEARPRDDAAPDTSYDALSSTLATSSIFNGLPTPESSLIIKHGGALIPQSAILELKTRSFRKKDQDIVGQEMPRLWVTQIHNFILAYHEAGLFDDIQNIDVSQRVEEWQSNNRDVLRKLSALLHKIVSTARSKDLGRLELRCREKGTLEIRESLPGVGQTLSEASQARWLRTQSHSESGSEEWLYPDCDDDDDDDNFGDDESEKDFTACSADDCGYCGHCSY